MKNIFYAQRGQAIVLIALAIVALIAITGLAIDGGNVLADRRQAQNAADTAAMAAALEKIDAQYNEGKTPQQTALAIEQEVMSIADLNGYDSSSVTIHNPPGLGCGDAVSPYASDTNKDRYIQVIIQSNVDTYFAPVVGVDKLYSCVESTSYISPPSQGNPFGWRIYVALALDGVGLEIKSGNTTLHAVDGDVFVNSSSTEAIKNNSTQTKSDYPGGIHFVVDNDWKNTPGMPPRDTDIPYGTWPRVVVVGNYSGSGKIVGKYSPLVQGADQYSQEEIESFLAGVPAPPTPPACPTGTAGSYNGTAKTVTSGDFLTGLNLGAGTWSFAGGIYCINGSGGLNITGATINSSSTNNKVTLIMGNQNVIINNSKVYFESLEVYTDDGNLNLNTSSALRTNRLRFISRGDGNFSVTGGSTIKHKTASIVSGKDESKSAQIPDAYFYFENGVPDWSGGNVWLTSPDEGIYEDLLIYMPISNEESVNYGGTSKGYLDGTFLAPGATLDVVIKSSQFQVHSQFIFNRIILESGVEIWNDIEDELLFEATSAAKVELVK